MSRIQRDTQRRWRELSSAQKAGILVLGGADLVAKLAAWHYLYHLPADRIRGKKRWWLPVTLVNGVGAPTFLIFGRKPKPAALQR